MSNILAVFTNPNIEIFLMFLKNRQINKQTKKIYEIKTHIVKLIYYLLLCLKYNFVCVCIKYLT